MLLLEAAFLINKLSSVFIRSSFTCEWKKIQNEKSLKKIEWYDNKLSSW